MSKEEFDKGKSYAYTPPTEHDPIIDKRISDILATIKAAEMTKCAMCDKLNGEHENWCEIQPIYYARCQNQAEQDAIESVLKLLREIDAKGGTWLKCYTAEQRKDLGYSQSLVEHAADVLSEIIYQNTKNAI